MTELAFMKFPIGGARKVRAPFRVEWSGVECASWRDTNAAILCLRLTGDPFWKRAEWMRDGYVYQHRETLDPRDFISAEISEALLEILAMDDLCTTCEGRGILYQYYESTPSKPLTSWQKIEPKDCPTCNGTGKRPS